MSRKIYIVEGSTGEYSDRTEWVVEAYFNKDSAQAKINILSRIYNEFIALNGGTNFKYFESGKRIFEHMKEHDANFQHDYTGTAWYLIETDLVDD